MCGIIGVIGCDAGRTAIEALTVLEYRGYDSWGVASIENNTLTVTKEIGLVKKETKVTGDCAIGHVRWATHGGVTRENAHPHIDCKKNIAVVHNGVIENYLELKKELTIRGHIFTSETDTEVIPHLLEESNANLENAVLEVTKKLKGSYALVVTSTNEPNKIVAARKESPLVIAKNHSAVFAASDTLPLAKHVNSFTALEDGEIAVLQNNNVTFRTASGAITKTFSPIAWKNEETTLQNHKHFMEKEIEETPESFTKALQQNATEVKEFAEEVKKAKRVVFVACGTARHAAIVGRYLFNKLAKKFCEVMIGSEFQYFAPEWNKDTLVIAVSQSGETADVLNGIREAKQRGARVFSIVNVEGSTLARESNKVLYIKCGPEIGVASTKAFLNQLAVLYLVAFAMTGNYETGVKELTKIPGKIREAILLNQVKAREISEKIKNQPSAYFIARGNNFAIAIEGALKLKEISYIHAEGMPAGELKHGTLALISNGVPVIAINPKNYTHDETITNIMETKARGAYIIGVSDEPHSCYDDLLCIPKVDEKFYPIVSTVPLFLLAYYTACSRGLNPDRPRNLAKSVTVR
ncbi:MAG: glutamine--fructose-6-phosphate transaminase (isomerizing) [Candidatus Micrarchaeota archaeon]